MVCRGHRGGRVCVAVGWAGGGVAVRVVMCGNSEAQPVL